MKVYKKYFIYWTADVKSSKLWSSRIVAYYSSYNGANLQGGVTVNLIRTTWLVDNLKKSFGGGHIIVLSFDHCAFDQLKASNHSLTARGTDSPFSHKSVVLMTHEHNVICRNRLICRSRGGLSAYGKKWKNTSNDNNFLQFSQSSLFCHKTDCSWNFEENSRILSCYPVKKR